MVQGKFILNGRVPIASVNILWNSITSSVDFVIDTGFTGDLQVTPKIANELGLSISGIINGRLASGATVEIETATAIAGMEGYNNYVTVLISDGMPLLGISFLEKFHYKASIDCKYKLVSLQRV